jgi:hypothetical protein
MSPSTREPGGPLLKELKGIQSAARIAIRVVRDLERETGGDIFGRFVIGENEELNEEVVAEAIEFLRHARHLYTTQELTLIVVAKA